MKYLTRISIFFSILFGINFAELNSDKKSHNTARRSQVYKDLQIFLDNVNL